MPDYKNWVLLRMKTRKIPLANYGDVGYISDDDDNFNDVRMAITMMTMIMILIRIWMMMMTTRTRRAIAGVVCQICDVAASLPD